MEKYIHGVTATVGTLSGESKANISKFIIITEDGNLFIEGIKQKEVPALLAKLVSVATEQAIAAEYAIREDVPTSDVYEDLEEDKATISGMNITYSGLFSS